MAAATKHQIRIYVGGTLGRLIGTAGTAILETGDEEGNPGGKTHVSGIKPLVDVTTNALTVAIGYRDSTVSAPSYTSEVTANSRSGFCDFRNEARYQRVRMTIAGTFNAAQGFEPISFPSGM